MKLIQIPILIVIGCFLAGAFGILHDQLTYTVSPEYFHKFKFIQFQVIDSLHTRAGVAIVGFAATWWMGLIISVPLIITGLFSKYKFFINVIKSYVLVLVITLLIGLLALLYGYIFIHEGTLPNYRYPYGLIDKVAFARVGIMHNFSYLGGIFGLIIGVIYLIIVRKSGSQSSE